ncbi:hypothetical protein CW712_05365 [Candidatus Bathyarchaeota archaeon]|nr:MAG: hypothetical protein CW712_05365 [Candidatus Bathyarchaeota archaeon]
MKCLVDYLRDELKAEASKVRVKDVRVGVVYTGVVLSSGHAGVAYTPVHEFSGCHVLPYAGSVAGRSSLDVINMALSPKLVEAAIGIAAVNALSSMAFEIYPEKYVSSNVDVLELIKAGDIVTMIGYFGPLVSEITRKTSELYVSEMKTIVDNRVNILSQSETSEALSASDVVLISGSTLVNKTMNEILSLTGNAREVVLLGPTASVVPQPLFKRGITAVMGIRILNPEKMLRVISEAGGTKQLLSTCAEKIAFLKTQDE